MLPGADSGMSFVGCWCGRETHSPLSMLLAGQSSFDCAYVLGNVEYQIFLDGFKQCLSLSLRGERGKMV